jgi:hypothetical protein
VRVIGKVQEGGDFYGRIRLHGREGWTVCFYLKYLLNTSEIGL